MPLHQIVVLTKVFLLKIKMSNVNKLKRFKQVLLVVVLLLFLVIHFFVPRLITEIQNPVVGLIKEIEMLVLMWLLPQTQK